MLSSMLESIGSSVAMSWLERQVQGDRFAGAVDLAAVRPRGRQSREHQRRRCCGDHPSSVHRHLPSFVWLALTPR